MNSVAPQRIYDWAAFRAEIEGIRIYDDPKQVELRSRDYFWYSPILTEDIGHYLGDLVVIPKDQDEVRRVAAAAAKLRIPITVRGGGTGNYGQCVPLEGGIILDMTKIDRIIAIEPGKVRVEGGARISRLDDAVRETGQELLMYPSTRRIATIGGFFSGGSGGIGSLRHGMLRDDGNVFSVKVLTVEPEPKIIELTGRDIHKVQHAYGTNGIILELEIGLTKATEWVHTAALFDTYEATLNFCLKALEDNLDCYLLTTVDRRFARFYTKFGELFPSEKDAVFAMIAPEEVARFETLATEFGGKVSFSMTLDELHKAGLQPAYECGWNHTTLQALKAEPGWTYLQVAYPRPFDVALVNRQIERYGETQYMHHEMARLEGEVQIFALPLVRFEGRDEMYRLIEELEQVDGCDIYDPHAYTIEDGGMKEIDCVQIEFKKQADPYGLLNPGKTRGWTADMALKN
ncbi:FAD-binding oxidoreductase [Ochrobactrum sp. MYb15]|uniref:FAD-binding oxidoreductase n=1 Tax=Brucella TaxID=234 RepID=UPI000464C265|nr:FAD-binding oxidoreductase [Brucella rhizosphaerae]PQZ50276.1 FAD-binding oxidoreductase [Ochrobactrum sp. MYb19]PRA68317.1 FAD-binding oxidoreductase [Ochrobactrum sp. MYb18]PRA74455.1 FAD-binding oxidoreductase [Brucella thiophenivorans]PRA90567.1 FAD-binding oxidoreductase [Ochrobactrum sp. MYb14]PRA96018.1 FAD-binding oxidoreductase [Ochrobactrum sp. MYb15]